MKNKYDDEQYQSFRWFPVGLGIWLRDIPPLTCEDVVKIALEYNKKSVALLAIGESLDSEEITLDEAQKLLGTVITGVSISALAHKYKPKWWQRRGWIGIMRRFGKYQLTQRKWSA
jgi:hypothetical protein